MSDLTSITGKALLDRKTMIKLLATLQPKPLDETSTVYHIGYERAKADAMAILAEALGPNYSTPVGTMLIRELRRDGS